ncbi:hypothetical protein D9758_011679 [Tetrapyrgos nigripes]|uniref:Uncharacterized protein n=1 Tax=Tetrapyrgos nigripes TaxID=182062 RepID=A0A8H5GCY1_9AGAR|nr:hypothetical protein D9758_011679 [Tetrapyrgos nigripes]
MSKQDKDKTISHQRCATRRQIAGFEGCSGIQDAAYEVDAVEVGFLVPLNLPQIPEGEWQYGDDALRDEARRHPIPEWTLI